jgi:hypothetical protein
MQQSTQPRSRPTGITILAVVALISGILSILVSFDLTGIAASAGGIGLGGLATVTGFLMLISGVLFLVLAYGLWGMRPWAWTLGVGLMAASFVLNILQYINNNDLLVAMIVSALIPAAILYYLFQPQVKAAFGRA